MEIVLKKPCPSCGGDQIVEKATGETNGRGQLIITEVPCYCIETDFPGYKVIGTADISDLADTVNDILDKVNDIMDKLNE